MRAITDRWDDDDGDNDDDDDANDDHDDDDDNNEYDGVMVTPIVPTITDR